MKSLFSVFILLGNTLLLAEAPDVSSVAADLFIPEMTNASPSPGKRVQETTPGWKQTAVYHALYLPPDWTPEGRFPLIVEWTGNRYKSKSGDECRGTPEDAKLGFGLSGGQGCIWVSLPYLDGEGTHNTSNWWGTASSYDPQPTLAYCRATVRHLCENFGADPKRVVLAGFSRGAIACNYLGLYDEETARLWCAFVCYSHYDGVRPWVYPGSDRDSALARLKRLQGRPQFICGENTNAEETERYLSGIAEGNLGAFTFCNSGYRNHDDAWVLRPGQTRSQLRRWLEAVLK